MNRKLEMTNWKIKSYFYWKNTAKEAHDLNENFQVQQGQGNWILLPIRPRTDKSFLTFQTL